jgi:hypothetical protein
MDHKDQRYSKWLSCCFLGAQSKKQHISAPFLCEGQTINHVIEVVKSKPSEATRHHVLTEEKCYSPCRKIGNIMAIETADTVNEQAQPNLLTILNTQQKHLGYRHLSEKPHFNSPKAPSAVGAPPHAVSSLAAAIAAVKDPFLGLTIAFPAHDWPERSMSDVSDLSEETVSTNDRSDHSIGDDVDADLDDDDSVPSLVSATNNAEAGNHTHDQLPSATEDTSDYLAIDVFESCEGSTQASSPRVRRQHSSDSSFQSDGPESPYNLASPVITRIIKQQLSGKTFTSTSVVVNGEKKRVFVAPRGRS